MLLELQASLWAPGQGEQAGKVLTWLTGLIRPGVRWHGSDTHTSPPRTKGRRRRAERRINLHRRWVSEADWQSKIWKWPLDLDSPSLPPLVRFSPAGLWCCKKNKTKKKKLQRRILHHGFISSHSARSASHCISSSHLLLLDLLTLQEEVTACAEPGTAAFTPLCLAGSWIEYGAEINVIFLLSGCHWLI